MQESQTCKRCGLISHISAAKCDCGFVFSKGTLEAPRIEMARVREILGNVGIAHWTLGQVEQELRAGSRLIQYRYCISYIRGSYVAEVFRLVRAGEGERRHGMGPSLITLGAGWWSLSGFFLTIAILWRNLRGGRDLTAVVLAALAESRT